MKDKWDNEGWCGWKGLLKTSKNDPFNRACAAHDEAYEKKNVSREYADKVFIERMKSLSGSSLRLKTRAFFYGGIVSTLGWLFWDFVD